MNDIPRQHLRLPIETRTFVEVEAPGLGTGESGRLVACHTLDVSREGLKVMIGERLLVGTILQLGVDLPDRSNTLYLAAEVRWCLAIDGGNAGWAAGFRILNAAGSDTDRWAALMKDLES